MERRLTLAIVSALALHAGLVAVGAWVVRAGTVEVPCAASAPEIEVALLVPDAEPTFRVPSSEAATSPGSSSASAPRATPDDSGRALAGVAAAAGETEALVGEVTGLAPGASELAPEGVDAAGDVVSQGVGEAPHRPIDLGLDGAIVARSLRGTHERASARRPSVTFDGWSENVVRSIAHTAAPSAGTALLTVEWDAQGRLASIRSSAESSHANTWRKFAESLRHPLAQRPRTSGKGLRLVYLVKSEFVKPGSRSKLPQSNIVSAEQLRDEHLPPAVSLNVGVKADTSPTGQRVVSVTLASSQVL